MRYLLFVLTGITLSGCIVNTINESNPHPNTPFIRAAPQSLALILDSAIADQFSIPSKVVPEGPGTPVVGWRRTLTNGFHNGFGSYFKPAPASGPADLSIDLVRADLGFSKRRAQITYKAQLLDATGKTLAVDAGTVESKSPVSRVADDLAPETECVADAVETLYEALSQSLVRVAVPVSRE
jgi:hypothetical protein